MKKVINSIFAYFGLNPVYKLENFRKAENRYANLITIEQQAIDFVHNALNVVNEAIRSELKRNGYNPEDIKKGVFVLSSTAIESKTDKRFKSQVYSVNGFVILRVEWKPNGFTLQTNSSAIAQEHKNQLKKGRAPHTGTKDIEAKEAKEVEIEALTNKKLHAVK